MSEPPIRIDDIRKAGFCVAGARRWFEANKLDFKSFLEHGVAVKTFLGTGDALAQRVVDRKRERQQNG